MDVSRKITILERLWFIFIIRKNEFHRSLDLKSINIKYLDRLDRKREVAHILSMPMLGEEDGNYRH